MNWQLNKIQYPVYNLGPGKRIGLWVQGCTLGCDGCINKTTWAKKSGRSVRVLEMVNWVISQADEYDGITISGGEPFQQYEQLITFSYLLKKKTGLTIYCYTGYYLEELYELFPDNLFCTCIDYLVDGRFEKNQHANTGETGSTNQTIYRLVEGIPIRSELKTEQKKWSLHVDEKATVYMAGIPKYGEIEKIENDLANKKINKKFI